MTIIELTHEDSGEIVYCWGREMGMTTIKSCINEHPKEAVTVRVIKMTAKEYDALPDYEGDC